MRASVLTAPRRLAVAEVAVPEPLAGEVLVEVSRCGVCGTDLHMVLEGWGQPGRTGGHEWSGRVAALGSGVEGFATGDLVVAGPLWCGQCRQCRAGRPSLCRQDSMLTGRGGADAFAEYAVTPAGTLHLVPVGLGEREAALTEPLAVALHAVTRSGARSGDRVLVSGAGPLGLLVTAALVVQGCTDVTVSEPAEARRAQALRVGAVVAVAPDGLPACPPAPMHTADGAFDVVLECSGNAAAMQAVPGLLAPGGTGVLVGTGISRPSYDPNRLLLNELTLTGAYNYDATGFPDALALLAGGALPVTELVHPDDVGLDDMGEAFARLRVGEIARKLLVDPRRQS